MIEPVLVAASMVGSGRFVLAREAAGRPIRLGGLDRGLVVAGAW